MPWTGGSYTKGNNSTGGWAGDAAAGIGIEAGRHDTQDNDFATGINQCLNKDGSNAATGNLNFGGYLPTNIGAGTAAAPAICAGNDTNTGMYSPSADAIGFANNGSDTLRITSSGLFGVGTTNPQDAIQVGTTTAISKTDSAGSNGTILGFNHYYSSGSKALTTGNRTVTIELGNSGGILKSTTGTQTADSALSGMNSYIQWGGSGDTILFSTGNTERGRFESNGAFAIGASGASARLTVKGADTTSSNFAGLFQDSAGATLLSLRNDGNFNTGTTANAPYNNTTASAANLFVTSGGTFQRSTSSLKYKTDVLPYTRGLTEVLALNPVFYKGKNDGTTQFAGLIAEDVDAAGLVEFVQYADDGTPDALAYGNMVALAFAAIKELNAKVEALEARIDVLEP